MAEMNHTETTNDTRADMDRETLHDYIKQIRYALHIGLASYGEVENVLNGFAIARMTNTPITGVTEPTHPTGTTETIGKFAEALRLLDILEDTPLAV